jgi:hypothetical protein
MRNLLLLTAANAFIFFFNVINAQTPNYLWAKSAGGSIDGNGNTYVCGVFSSPSITFGSTTLLSTGNQNLFVVKYDLNGNVLWAKSAGGAALDIIADNIGNIFITGTFQSSTITFGTTTLTNSGAEDMFIAKYDTSGNVIWAKSAGGNSVDQGSSIASDGVGNTFVTGWFASSSITFGSITLINASSGLIELFIVKYDANGNVVWANRASGRAGGTCITVDGVGNSYVSGNFTGSSVTFGSTVINNSGGSNDDIFIAKYDISGTPVWAKAIGGSAFDYVNGLVSDSNGNTYLTGWFQSPSIAVGSITLTNSGVSEMFVAKFNTNGNSVWAKSYAGGGLTGNIAVDANENTFITGSFANSSMTFGNMTLTNAGNENLFIAKYDASGNTVWAKSAGGASYDSGKDIAINGDGSIYLVGRFSSPSITFGSTTLSNSGNEDMFIAKLEKTLPAQEHCDFTWSSSNMTVNFSMSNPNCTNFIWDFGNGNTSTINPNPIVTYATPGTYSACFQCNIPANCLSCATITVPSNSSGTTGIEELQNTSGFSIYPNPSSNYITIENNNVQLNSTYFILNSIGQLVLSGQLTGELTTVDISGLSNGIYLVQIETDSGRVSKQIIKN